MYLEKAFDGATFGGMQPGEQLPVARELGETSLMLLVHPTLGKKEKEATTKAVARDMAEAL